MQPLRIRIDRIVDFGTVVSLVGVDTDQADDGSEIDDAVDAYA